MTKRKDTVTLPNRTPQFLSLEIAAAELCIAPSTFAEWVARGALPKPHAIGPSGATQRWCWKEILAYITGKPISDELPNNNKSTPEPFFRVSALNAKRKAENSRA